MQHTLIVKHTDRLIQKSCLVVLLNSRGGHLSSDWISKWWNCTGRKIDRGGENCPVGIFRSPNYMANDAERKIVPYPSRRLIMGRFSGQQTACLQGNIWSFKIATYLNVLFSLSLSSAHVNKTLHFIQSRKRLIDGIEKNFGHETIALLNILHLHTHYMKYHRFREYFLLS